MRQRKTRRRAPKCVSTTVSPLNLLTVLEIKSVQQKLQKHGVKLDDPYIQYALRSQYARGDIERAGDLLLIILESFEGMIKEYKPNVKLLGAENRNGVTCWLDALLFALFSRLSSFEPMLYNSFSDEPRIKLSALLRLWVNLLRSGNLITTDITKLLQDAIAKCGWSEAAELCQHDASEAFTVLTGILELPLLTLKMDIYHTGKEDDNDDHKFVTERLLEVAIPPPSEVGDSGKITLEDCLEAYFNNRIEVKRYLERRSTVTSMKAHDIDAKAAAVHVETVELGSQDDSWPSTPLSPNPGTPSSPPFLRNRAPSIVQQRFVPEKTQHEDSRDGKMKEPPARSRKGSVRKEVMMPAWQFFSLIPWYTRNVPTSNEQVASHFSSQRPVLGICLKRYSMTDKGTAVRLDTKVDIPLEVGLPHFIHDDNLEDDIALYGNFKLSLQSVVCHRGNSVDSGHYIALVRGTTPVGDQRPTSNDVPVGQRHSVQDSKLWLRFDDLAKERITLIDIDKAMETETPYLLFYQIVPVEGDPGNITVQERPQSMITIDSTKTNTMDVSAETTATDDSVTSGRPSMEASQEAARGRSPNPQNRRQSIAFSEPDITQDGHKTNGLATTASKSQPPSRRSSVIRKIGGHSRSTSQNGEKRSSALLKMTGMISREKVSQEETADIPGVIVSNEEVASNTSSSKHILKKEHKREKSANRVRTLPNTLVKQKANKPDRECIVM
ncbi:MAG: hypothetical protein Q9227_007355 [Pyrenula ochraceoflavens]